MMKIQFLTSIFCAVRLMLTMSFVCAAQPCELEFNLHPTDVMSDKGFVSYLEHKNQELKKEASGYYLMPNRSDRVALSEEYNNECQKFIDSQPNFALALNKYIEPFLFASEREKNEGCCFFYANFFLQDSYPHLFEKITIQLQDEGRWSGIDSIEECFHDLDFELIKKFIDEFMIETDTPQAGDLILYYEGPQDKVSSRGFYDIRHVGIMNSSSQVRSKWGWYDQCIYLHNVTNTLAEYGSYVKFWTLRSEYQMYRVEKNQIVESSYKNSTRPWCSIL